MTELLAKNPTLSEDLDTVRKREELSFVLPGFRNPVSYDRAMALLPDDQSRDTMELLRRFGKDDDLQSPYDWLQSYDKSQYSDFSLPEGKENPREFSYGKAKGDFDTVLGAMTDGELTRLSEMSAAYGDALDIQKALDFISRSSRMERLFTDAVDSAKSYAERIRTEDARNAELAREGNWWDITGGSEFNRMQSRVNAMLSGNMDRAGYADDVQQLMDDSAAFDMKLRSTPEFRNMPVQEQRDYLNAMGELRTVLNSAARHSLRKEYLGLAKEAENATWRVLLGNASGLMGAASLLLEQKIDWIESVGGRLRKGRKAAEWLSGMSRAAAQAASDDYGESRKAEERWTSNWLASKLASGTMSMGMTLAAGPIGLPMMAASSAGSAYEEAKQSWLAKGDSEKEASRKAFAEGVVAGGITYATEHLSSLMGGGVLPGLGGNGAKKLFEHTARGFSGRLAKAIGEGVKGMGEEWLEEMVENPLQDILKSVRGDSELVKAYKEDGLKGPSLWLYRLGVDSAVGVASSLLTGAADGLAERESSFSRVASSPAMLSGFGIDTPAIQESVWDSMVDATAGKGTRSSAMALQAALKEVADGTVSEGNVFADLLCQKIGVTHEELAGRHGKECGKAASFIGQLLDAQALGADELLSYTAGKPLAIDESGSISVREAGNGLFTVEVFRGDGTVGAAMAENRESALALQDIIRTSWTQAPTGFLLRNKGAEGSAYIGKVGGAWFGFDESGRKTKAFTAAESSQLETELARSGIMPADAELDEDSHVGMMAGDRQAFNGHRLAIVPAGAKGEGGRSVYMIRGSGEDLEWLRSHCPWLSFKEGTAPDTVLVEGQNPREFIQMAAQRDSVITIGNHNMLVVYAGESVGGGRSASPKWAVVGDDAEMDWLEQNGFEIERRGDGVAVIRDADAIRSIRRKIDPAGTMKESDGMVSAADFGAEAAMEYRIPGSDMQKKRVLSYLRSLDRTRRGAAAAFFADGTPAVFKVPYLKDDGKIAYRRSAGPRHVCVENAWLSGAEFTKTAVKQGDGGKYRILYPDGASQPIGREAYDYYLWLSTTEKPAEDGTKAFETTAQAPDAVSMRLAEHLGRLTNTRIAWLTSEQIRAEALRIGKSEDKVQGWYDGGDRTLYLNPLDPRGVSFVMGHELYHDMVNHNRDIAVAIKNIVLKAVKGKDGMTEGAKRLYRKIDAAYAMYRDDDKAFAEEFYADVMGMVFSDPEFMLELGDELEARRKGFRGRFLDAIRKFLDAVCEFLGREPDARAKELFTAYDEVRKSLSALTADYIESNMDEMRSAMTGLVTALYRSGPEKRDADLEEEQSRRKRNREQGRRTAVETAKGREETRRRQTEEEFRRGEIEAGEFMREAAARKAREQEDRDRKAQAELDAEAARLAKLDVQERADLPTSRRTAEAQAEEQNKITEGGSETAVHPGHTAHYQAARAAGVPLTSMSFPDNSRVPEGTIFAVVDVARGADVRTSYDDGYDQSLQNNDTGVKAKEQIENYAKTPNADLMLSSHSSSQGIPVIEPHNGDTVIHNNGIEIRRRMSELGTDGEYLEKLRGYAREKGLPFPDGMKTPMLVAYLPDGLTHDQLIDLAKRGNLKTTRDIDTAQRAAADALVLATEKGRNILMLLQDTDSDRICTAANSDFVRRIYGILANEDGDLVDGEPTDRFEERIGNALTALLFSTLDEERRKNIIGNLINKAASLGMEGMKKALVLKAPKLNAIAMKDQSLDLSPELAKAIESIILWKQSGDPTPATYANQLHFNPSENMSEAEKPLFIALGEASVKSQKAVRDLLDRYIEPARKQLESPDLFGEERTKAQLIEAMVAGTAAKTAQEPSSSPQKAESGGAEEDSPSREFKEAKGKQPKQVETSVKQSAVETPKPEGMPSQPVTDESPKQEDASVKQSAVETPKPAVKPSQPVADESPKPEDTAAESSAEEVPHQQEATAEGGSKAPLSHAKAEVKAARQKTPRPPVQKPKREQPRRQTVYDASQRPVNLETAAYFAEPLLTEEEINSCGQDANTKFYALHYIHGEKENLVYQTGYFLCKKEIADRRQQETAQQGQAEAEKDGPDFAAIDASLKEFIAARIPMAAKKRHMEELAASQGLPLKVVQERCETVLVSLLADINRQSKSDRDNYDDAVMLYKGQPKLDERTSTSTMMQAYSTPAPLAFALGKRIGIESGKSVYEPTAGNGMLVAIANHRKTTVNELEESRFKALQRQGFKAAYQQDASSLVLNASFDRIIMNPPFGKAAHVLTVDGVELTHLDHQIAVNALQTLKADGRAAIIVGANTDGGLGVNGSATLPDIRFMDYLYNRFNVVDNFIIDGKLYEKQGATYPVRVITINGRKAFDGMSRPLAPETLEVVSSWEEIGDRLVQELPPIQDVPETASDFTPRSVEEAMPRYEANVPEPARVTGDSISDELRSRMESADEAADALIADGLDMLRKACKEFSDAGRGRLSVSFTGFNPEQLVAISKITVACGKIGYAYVTKGIVKAGDWLCAMVGKVGGILRSAGMADAEVEELLKHVWHSDYEHDGEVKSIEQWAQEYSRPEPPSPERHGESEGKEEKDNGSKTSEPEVQEDDGARQQPEAEEASPVDAEKASKRQLSAGKPVGDMNLEYVSASNGRQLGTVSPKYMAEETVKALNRLIDEYGSTDNLVIEELGYSSAEEMYKSLAAEQIDGVAMCIDSFRRGDGFILTDQTGIGKGRQCAAMMRWADRHGYLPVFFTQQPSLFSDMYRDSVDVGFAVHPLMISSDPQEARIVDENGEVVFTLDRAAVQDAMIDALCSGKGTPVNAVFTTYSQVSEYNNRQQSQLSKLLESRKCVVIMDEAHNAAGFASNIGLWFKGGTRRLTSKERKTYKVDAMIYQGVLNNASNLVMYTSATFAKFPSNMPLYFRTPMSKAVEDVDDLPNILRRGGIPLQQILSRELAGEGALLRREKDFSGIVFESKTADGGDPEKLVRNFDETALVLEKMKNLSHELHGKLKSVKYVNDSGNEAARFSHSEFASSIRNYITQIVFASKCDAVVSEVREIVGRGEKPVVALVNTMESMLMDYVDRNGLAAGDVLDMSYRDILDKACDGMMEVMDRRIGQKVSLNPDEIGLGDAFRSLKDAIGKLKIDYPISPIDYIKNRLERLGITVAEVTGRTLGVNYDDNTLTVRTADDKDKKKQIFKFNSGEKEALIVNSSGATGVSMHASERFKDRRKRVMLVAQSHLDVNVVMQMLGRVNRSGQVVLPSYVFLTTPLASETRANMALARKLRSLNANTTADDKGAFSVGEDYMNAYGDEVANQILSEEEDLADRIGMKARGDMDDNEEQTGGVIAKFTNLISILPNEEQKRIYGEIDRRYRDLVEQARKTGTYNIEIEKFNDWDAVQTGEKRISDGDGSGSFFGLPLVARELDVSAVRSIMTEQEVLDIVRENLGGSHVEMMRNFTDRHAIPLEQKIDKIPDAYAERAVRLGTNPANVSMVAEDAVRNAHKLLDEIQIMFRDYAGKTLELTAGGNKYNAILVDVRFGKGAPTSPLKASSVEFVFAVADTAGFFKVPVSKLKNGAFSVESKEWGKPFGEVFTGERRNIREKRIVIEGNLLKAIESLASGRIITYRTHEGEERTGLLMPKSFEMDRVSADSEFFKNTHQAVLAHVNGTDDFETKDGLLKIIISDYTGTISLVTPNGRGKSYYTDSGLIDLFGDFIRHGGVWRNVIYFSTSDQKIDDLGRLFDCLYAMGTKVKAVAPATAERGRKYSLDGGNTMKAGIEGDFEYDGDYIEKLYRDANITGRGNSHVLKHNALFDISSVPPVLRWLGMTDGFISIQVKIMRKLWRKHRVSPSLFSKVPSGYSSPVMVYREGDGISVVTDLLAEDGEGRESPVMVYLRQNQNYGGGYIASVYSRTSRGEEQYINRIHSGDVLYIDKEKALHLPFKDEVKSSITTLKVEGSIKTPSDYLQSDEHLNALTIIRKKTNSNFLAEKIMQEERQVKLSLMPESEIPPEEKTKEVYKLMRLVSGGDGGRRLQTLFIARENYELGKWYKADVPDLSLFDSLDSGYAYLVDGGGKVVGRKAMKSPSSLPPKQLVLAANEAGKRWITVTEDARGNRKYGNVGLNGSGAVAWFAMRPGIHAGSLPVMEQIGGGKLHNLRADDLVWVRGRVAYDEDEDRAVGRLPGKELNDRLPRYGYVRGTSSFVTRGMAWYISRAFKPEEIISDSEAQRVVDDYNMNIRDKDALEVPYDYLREGDRRFYADTMQLEPRREGDYTDHSRTAKSAMMKKALKDGSLESIRKYSLAEEHAMQALRDIANGKEYGILHNSMYGEIQYPLGSQGRKGHGFLHIIEQRMSKDGETLDEAIETAKKVGIAAEIGDVSSKQYNTVHLDYGGVRAIVAFTQDKTAIITGYEIIADDTNAAIRRASELPVHPHVSSDEIVAAMKNKITAPEEFASGHGEKTSLPKHSLSEGRRARHSQVNPIVVNGDVRAEYQDLLDSETYTPETIAGWDNSALAWFAKIGGMDKAVEMVEEGIEPGGKVGEMIRRHVMESEEFRSLPPDRREAIEMRHVLAGQEWGREGVARRLASMTVDSPARLRQFLARMKAKMTEEERKRFHDAIQKETGIDIDGIPDDIARDRRRLDRVLTAATAATAGFGDKLYEYWINAILSAPQTHLANTLGNLANASYELVVKRFAEASINLFARRPDAASFADYKAMWKAFDWKAAWNSARTAFMVESLTEAGKYQDWQNAAIAGRAGRIIRIPTRLLRMADELAKAVIVPVEAAAMARRLGRAKGLHGGELDSFIKKELSSETSASVMFGRRKSLELTFQEDPGSTVRHLIQLSQGHDMTAYVLKYMLPFKKTPYNLLRQGIRKGPLGVFSLAGETVSALRGRQSIGTVYIEHAAEQLLAWGLVGLCAAMSGGGSGDDDNELPFITGSDIGGSRGERLFKGRHLPAYSIRIGGKYYSYRRIEPLSTMLATVADGIGAWRTAETTQDATKAMTDMLEATARTVGEKTYLNSIGQIIELIDDPGRNFGRWGTDFLASWIPNAYRQASKAFDDNIWDASVHSSGSQWWKDQFHVTLSKAGFARLSPKIDCFGRPVTKDEAENAGPGDIAWRIMVPVSTASAGAMDEAEKLIWNWNRQNPEKEYWPGMPSFTFSHNGRKYMMTGKDYADFEIEAGRLAHRRILYGINARKLRTDKPREKDVELIKGVLADSRKRIRLKFLRERRCKEIK